MRVTATQDYRLIRYLDSELFPDDTPVRVGPGTRFWVAWDKGRPLAFGGLQLVDNNSAVFLHRVGVLPEARGRRLQARLIQARLKWARAHGYGRAITYTVPENWPSANNLIRAGFTQYRPEFAWAGLGNVYWFKDLR